MNQTCLNPIPNRYVIKLFVLCTFLFITAQTKAQDHTSILSEIDLITSFERALKTNNINLIADSGYKLADYYSSVQQFEHTTATYRQIAAHAKKLNVDSVAFAAKHAESYIYLILGKKSKCVTLCNDIINSKKAPIGYIASAQYMLAQHLTNELKYELSNEKLAISIDIFNELKDTLGLAECYRLIGNNYRHLTQYTLAISNYINAIELLEEKNSYLVVNIYFSLINLFVEQRNFSKAKEYLLRVDEYKNVIPNDKQKHRILLHKAQIFFADKQYELAQQYANDALDYFIDYNLDQLKPPCFLLLLNENIRINNPDLASQYLDSLLRYTHHFSSKKDWFNLYISSGKLHQLQNDFKKAAIAFEDAQNSIQINLNLRYNCEYHSAMYTFYKGKKDVTQALKHLEILDYLKDSIFIQDQSEMLNELEAKHRKVQLSKEIEKLNLQNETSLAQIKLQKKSLQLSILALLILGLLAYAIFYFYKKLKTKNDQLKIAYADKDILLREIHHRVKNNLQIISSLLALQSKYITDNNALNALKQGQDRVYSMALIHQDLYQSHNLKGVDTKEYFVDLIDNLFDSYNIDEDKIKLEFDVDPIMLDVDTMIPLGLVMNELVSNALKHAFNNQNHGKINVYLKKSEDCLILKVSDNGKGVSDEKLLYGKSFGFELINAFARKLKADINIDIHKGLSIELRIKNYVTAA